MKLRESWGELDSCSWQQEDDVSKTFFWSQMIQFILTLVPLRAMCNLTKSREQRPLFKSWYLESGGWTQTGTEHHKQPHFQPHFQLSQCCFLYKWVSSAFASQGEGWLKAPLQHFLLGKVSALRWSLSGSVRGSERSVPRAGGLALPSWEPGSPASQGTWLHLSCLK